MSDNDSDPPPLTREQQAIVDQPPGALLLLVADAGTGKTHTLTRRVELLAASPLDGTILVLTFSRAVVYELQVRLAAHGRRVQAVAFDTWALDLLTRIDPSADWSGLPPEARLDAALQHLTTGLVDELYDDLLHVVIDEAQDLAGRTREMVEALLERVDCGFTIAGDPEQAVHADGAGFLGRLREAFGGDLAEARLTQNFRNRTWEAASALSHTARLSSLKESDHYAVLRAALCERVDVGRLGQGFAADALTRYKGTTAVLCRTSAQAMIVSADLQRIGVPHRLCRAPGDRVAPPWVGRLVGMCQGALLSRPRFEELVATLAVPQELTDGRLWDLLQRTAGGNPADLTLELTRLLAGIAAGRLPDELTAQEPAQIMVSSFRRAKGLEFDRILVADPGPVPPGDLAAEARLLYLAMTRARYEMFRLEGPDMRGLAVDPGTGRWWRPRAGMQLLEGDLHTAEPAGVRDFLADAAQVQSYLATAVQSGDAAVLERLYVHGRGPQESPPYVLVHGGYAIGVASERFRRDLYRLIGDGREPAEFPRTITGIQVDAVRTVVGSAAAGAHAGLGPYGVWLAPRPAGIGQFIWDRSDHHER
ncbi:UvrD-helicase domain-containing protein [Nonomuraea sp. NPDC050536]|uniref:UvrD-helicase domain-containing protein n=1 Tax=Nonomuraea sp. NPDC050536 TaxID=3364366 RepID=UPI0037C7A903